MPTKKDDVPDKRRYLSSAARKEEILDAALIEFADRTYNAVSMERLAECAGLSKAGIYTHFKSKEEIFHALLERTTQQLRDFQGWLPDEDLTLPELVDVYIDRLYTTFDSPRHDIGLSPASGRKRQSAGAGAALARGRCAWIT